MKPNIKFPSRNRPADANGDMIERVVADRGAGPEALAGYRVLHRG